MAIRDLFVRPTCPWIGFWICGAAAIKAIFPRIVFSTLACVNWRNIGVGWDVSTLFAGIRLTIKACAINKLHRSILHVRIQVQSIFIFDRISGEPSAEFGMEEAIADVVEAGLAVPVVGAVSGFPRVTRVG